MQTLRDDFMDAQRWWLPHDSKSQSLTPQASPLSTMQGGYHTGLRTSWPRIATLLWQNTRHFCRNRPHRLHVCSSPSALRPTEIWWVLSKHGCHNYYITMPFMHTYDIRVSLLRSARHSNTYAAPWMHTWLIFRHHALNATNCSDICLERMHIRGTSASDMEELYLLKRVTLLSFAIILVAPGFWLWTKNHWQVASSTCHDTQPNPCLSGLEFAGPCRVEAR